jgi:DNA-binding PadR family transcriptional regulator
MFQLTRTEEIVLLAVYQLEDEAYGVSIRRQIEKMVRKKFSVGAIYVPLDRLAQKGLLSSSAGEPTPERGGRSKRFYKITSEGISALKETKRLNDTIWTVALTSKRLRLDL